MDKLEFSISTSGARSHDAAYLSAGDDPRQALVEAAVSSISTDVEITVGDVKMHLAAWMDPYHWSEDWEKAGVEDVDDLLAGAVTA